MKLLAIGNGFDLAHGLPTGYPSFLRFLEYCEACIRGEYEQLEDLRASDQILFHFVNWCVKQAETQKELRLFFDSPHFLLDCFRLMYRTSDPESGKRWVDFEAELGGVIQDLDRLYIMARAKLDVETEDNIRKRKPEGGKFPIFAKSEWDPEHHVFIMREIKAAQIAEEVVLCLEGSDICRTQAGNDYYVPFALPSSDSDMPNPEIVRVYRREFSYNESTLRVYYDQEHRNTFHQLMPVSVYRDQNGTLRGSLTNLPAREDDLIRNWLRAEGPQYVFIGVKKERTATHLRAEIQPGIFCNVKTAGAAVPGTSGKLALKDNSITVTPLSEGDKTYICPGRILELLLMDSCFRKEHPTPRFTAAGLPQEKIEDAEVVQQLIYDYPPRFGQVAFRRNIRIKAAHPSEVPYGYLNLPGDGRVIISNKKEEHTIPWHQLSFLDGTVREIRDRILHTQWHYHDRETKVIHRDGKQESVLYRGNMHLPVIFHPEYNLRYPKKELGKYVFPPHELEEYGIPERFYPLAEADEKNLFVELSPGRIVKIPDSLLRAAGNDEERHLKTSCFGTGDLVYLSTKRTKPGTPMAVTLKDVQYGIRSMISGNVWLPVLRKDPDGAVILGMETWKLCYPGYWNNPWESAFLCQDNRLRKTEGIPNKGDTVFIRMNENGEYETVSPEGLPVTLSQAGTEEWRTGWLRLLLTEGDREEKRRFFELVGRALPMRVETVESGVLTVFYPQPCMPQAGDLLCCQMIGALPPKYIILRAGTNLLRLDMSHILHVTDGEAKDILNEADQQGAFADGGRLWIYCRGPHRYQTGRLTDRSSTRRISIFASVEGNGAQGFLCQDSENEEWLWFPLQQVARAETPNVQAVGEILEKYQEEAGTLEVVVMENGQVSWLQGKSALRARFDSLRADQLKREVPVTVERTLLEDPQNDQYAYLCHELPWGNIYQLVSEIPKKKGDILQAVCVRKSADWAKLRPAREIRTLLHLTKPLLMALQRGYSITGTEIDPEKVRNRLKEGLETRDTTEMTGPPFFSKSVSEITCLMGNYARESLKMMRQELGKHDETALEFRKKTVKILQTTLTQSDLAWEILPFGIGIAFVAILWWFDEKASEEVYQHIKKHTELYCNEEYIRDFWLLNDEPIQTRDHRRLLNMIDFRGRRLEENRNSGKGNVLARLAGNLTYSEKSQMEKICRVVLHRSSMEFQRPDANLARCLLYLLDRKQNQELRKAWTTVSCDILRRDQNAETFFQDPEAEVFISRWTEFPGNTMGIYHGDRFRESIRRTVTQN